VATLTPARRAIIIRVAGIVSSAALLKILFVYLR
jgi:hypothetical protein